MSIEKAQLSLANNDFEEAKKILRSLLLRDKVNKDAMYLLSIAEAELGNVEEALNGLSRIIATDPQHAAAHYTKAKLLIRLNRHFDALPHHNRAVKHLASNPWAFINRGISHAALKNFTEAIDDFDMAIKLDPTLSAAFGNKGNALFETKLFEQSIEFLDKAIELDSFNVDALLGKSACLTKLKRPEEALIYAERAIELKPDYAEAWSSRGNALNDLKRHEEALASYKRAIELKPDYAEAWNNRGVALNDLRRHEEALASYERSIELKPDYAEAWNNRGVALNDLKRHEDSATSFFKADSLKKQRDFDFGRAHHQMMLSCNWTDYASYTETINQGIERGEFLAQPFGYQGIAESELLLKKCAEIYCNQKFPASLGLFSFNRSRSSRIRIGYLCGEFRSQATSHLMTGIWEHHDSLKFELFGLDNGWGDDSDYRKRIKIAFPNFSDISALSDLEVARFINETRIDILVNLNGYFGKPRQEVFALKPALTCPPNSAPG